MIRSRYFKMIVVLLGVVVPFGLTATPVLAQQNTDGPGYYMGAGQDSKPSSVQPLTNKSTKNVIQATSPATFPAECPSTIKCVVIPAAYSPNDGNIEDYGNYDTTNRPSDMAINSIVIHDTEGDLQSVLDHFKDSKAYASTQYVIAQDGTVYQMVQNKDLPWHSGNWWYNMHSIGIEHVGHAALGGTEYTPAMYRSSAELVKHLTSKYNIPRDRGHIVGHDNVPAPKTSGIAGMHTDPGPFWNWQDYMTRINGNTFSNASALNAKSNFNITGVTVAPVWPLNKQVVTGCSVGSDNGCVPAGLHPTNFVYLRTEPRTDAPLFTDPVLGQGTTDIKNNAARLFWGQTFAVAGVKPDNGGIWLKVAVNGVPGWFYSPWNAPTAFPTLGGKHATPKAGKTSIPTYGRPSPENTAYPNSLLSTAPASFWIPTMAPTTPLAYQVNSGQRYKVIDEQATNDHFYAWSITANQQMFPYDHTVFKGNTKYVEVWLGNRVGFLKKDDVDIK